MSILKKLTSKPRYLHLNGDAYKASPWEKVFRSPEVMVFSLVMAFGVASANLNEEETVDPAGIAFGVVLSSYIYRGRLKKEQPLMGFTSPSYHYSSAVDLVVDTMPEGSTPPTNAKNYTDTVSHSKNVKIGAYVISTLTAVNIAFDATEISNPFWGTANYLLWDAKLRCDKILSGDWVILDEPPKLKKPEAEKIPAGQSPAPQAV